MNYSEKLKDPRWQKKRLEILQRDDFACRNCGDDKSTLHVHHKIYINGNDPWNYDESLLITLCESCHELEESELKQYIPLFIETLKKSPFFADDLRELSWGLSHLKLAHIPGVVASAYSYAMRDPEMQSLIIDKYFKALEEARKQREETDKRLTQLKNLKETIQNG